MRQPWFETANAGSSLLHRSHPAVKILLTLVFLVSLATVSRRAPLLLTADLALLVFGILAARLPLGRVLRMAAAVLPFAFLFALFAVLAGDTNRAGLLIVRSYLSALAVVLLVGTSRVSDLIAGLEFLHAPQFLLSVMQFLWRYLAVLSAEAATMRNASLSRAGSMRAIELRQAAGAAGILFARAWARAQAVHQAMLSRGFEGTLPRFRQPRFTASDVMLGVAGSAVVVAVRLAA